MKAFLLSVLALVVISVGANQILVRMEGAGAIGSTTSVNVRVD